MRQEQLAQRRAYEARVPRFWMVLGIFMALLALAKIFNANAVIDSLGRQMLRSEDEYQGRRLVQSVLIIQAGIIGVAAIAAAAWFVRKTWRQYRLAIGATIYLATFCFIRAVSLHQVDAALRDGWCGVQLQTYFDLLGIGPHRRGRRTGHPPRPAAPPPRPRDARPHPLKD